MKRKRPVRSSRRARSAYLRIQERAARRAGMTGVDAARAATTERVPVTIAFTYAELAMNVTADARFWHEMDLTGSDR